MRCLVTDVVGGAGSSPGERWRTDGHEVCGMDAFIDSYYSWQKKTQKLSIVHSKTQFTIISDCINEKVFGEVVNMVERPCASWREALQIQILPEWDLCQW